MINKNDLTKGIYEALDVNSLNLPKDKFFYRSKSKNSIGFKIDLAKPVSDFFYNAFDLENPDVFEKKLEQSISGDGGELSKNNALHSSSLCSLLLFYNVSENNPFYVTFKDGTIHTYTKVYFEIKNKVIRNPSNMDVVLVNEKTKEILFIECKFSEYLAHSNNYKLKKSYVDKYGDYFDAINFKEMKVFPEGIKQLIAHYIGIKNFKECNYKKGTLKGFYDDGDPRREIYNKQYANIAFMEVIFKLPYQEFEEYKDETEKVFKYLDSKNEITILGTKTYQELFVGDNANILSPLVASYYNLAKQPND